MSPRCDSLVKRLDILFRCFSDNGVTLSLRKCTFGRREEKFWGHIVSEEGCRPDPSIVEAVNSMKPPTRVRDTEILGDVWMTSSTHSPVRQGYIPRTKLTHGNVDFNWTDRCQEAFDELKARLTRAPVHARANIHQPLMVTTDASNINVGRVLSQIQQDETN